MDEQKIKVAFRKVKQDIFLVSKQIDDLKNEMKKAPKPLKSTSKLAEIESKKYDNFVSNVEKELSSINLQLKENNDMIVQISKKQEFAGAELNLLKDSFVEKKEELEKKGGDAMISIEDKMQEVIEMVSEKNSVEMSAMRLEFTEEIAKIYDKFFNEILDLKNELNTKVKELKKKSKKKEKEEKVVPEKKLVEKEIKTQEIQEDADDELYPSTSKKDSKMKKIAKWLFVDEEEDEIEDIRGEIEEDSKQRKKSKKDDELY